MKFKTLVLVGLALVCGSSAAVGVSKMRQNADEAGRVQTTPVAMAASDVPRGVLLTPSDVRIEQWPKSMAPATALGSVEEVLERAVLVPLVTGEPILQGKLASKDSGRGLAAMIPRGMRAFTIRTPTMSSGVGGFILPGNRVDVLLTTSGFGASDTTGGGATTTLLQNVEVMAVAQRLDAPEANKVDPKEASSVTLLVTPDQAAKLDLGMNKGLLHLALRNPEDDAEADTRPATMNQLRFHQERPLPSNTGRNLAGFFTKTLAGLVGKQRPATTADEASPTAVAKAPAERQSRPATVHTLRGVQRGSIRLEW